MNRIAAQGISHASNIPGLALTKLRQTVKQTEGLLPKENTLRLEKAITQLSYRSIGEEMIRFNQMVKDISHQLAKEINFKIEGDALIAPEKFSVLQESLVHLVRNSVDHGIEESSQERKLENQNLVP